MNTLPPSSENQPTAPVEALEQLVAPKSGERDALIQRLSEEALGNAEAGHVADSTNIDEKRNERAIIDQQIGAFMIDAAGGNEYPAKYRQLSAIGVSLQHMKADAIANSDRNTMTKGV